MCSLTIECVLLYVHIKVTPVTDLQKQGGGIDEDKVCVKGHLLSSKRDLYWTQKRPIYVKGRLVSSKRGLYSTQKSPIALLKVGGQRDLISSKTALH